MIWTDVEGTVLFLSSVALVMIDAIVTLVGWHKGLREANPFLRFIMLRFGTMGLIASRIVALVLLAVLFKITEVLEWLLFSGTFLVLMGGTVLVGIRNLRNAAKQQHQQHHV